MRRACLSSVIATGLALPAGAAAAPAVTGEFPLGGSAVPHRLTAGPDGNMWVVIDGDGANDVARVKPDGTVDKFDVSNISFPGGITAGPDGDIWVTMNGKVGHFSPATPTVGTVFNVPEITDARELTFASDGNVWTGVAGKVLRIKPDGSSTVSFAAPDITQARGATVGSDGAVYIGDQASGKITRTTLAGVVTSFDANPGLQDVQAGPNGQFAFSAPVQPPERVGLVTPPGAVKTIDVPVTALDPTGMTFGLDGAYWFANFGGSNLARLTTTGDYTVLGGLSANSGPRYVEAGPNGTLWVSEETAGKIARVSGLEAPKPPDTTPPPTTTTTTPTTTTGTGTTPPPPPPDTKAPVIALRKPARVKRGSSFSVSLTLDEQATVSAQLQRSAAGRRRGGRCVAPSRKLRRAKRCTRALTAVSRGFGLLGPDAASFRMPTKVGKRKLAPGRYRLVVSARDAAGNVGKASVDVTVRG